MCEWPKWQYRSLEYRQESRLSYFLTCSYVSLHMSKIFEKLPPNFDLAYWRATSQSRFERHIDIVVKRVKSRNYNTPGNMSREFHEGVMETQRTFGLTQDYNDRMMFAAGTGRLMFLRDNLVAYIRRRRRMVYQLLRRTLPVELARRIVQRE